MRYFCIKITKMKLQSFHTFLMATVAFSVFSCSDNDDKIEDIAPQQPTTEQLLLVKKITQTTYLGSMGSETSATDFVYDGNQLTSTQTVSGAYTYGSVFHYDGEKVTSVDYTQNDLPDGSTYFYYNGELLDHTLSGDDQQERTNYSYSSGKLSSIESLYPSGPSQQILQTKSYTYNEAGNFTEATTTNYFSGVEISNAIYEYDNNNNPYNGLNKYLRLVMNHEGFNGLTQNNPVSRTVYSPINSATPYEYYYDLEYNEQNYPTSIKRYTGNDALLSETLIEYQ